MKINEKSKKEATKMKSGRKIGGFISTAGIVSLVLALSIISVSAVNVEAVQGVEMLGKVQSNDSLLRSPGRLAFANDILYVVDSYRNSIQTFDAMGNYMTVIGFLRPSAVAASPDGTLYIGSNVDYSVAIFQNGNITGYLGDGSYEFWSIADIDLDNVTGNIYIADNVGNAVMVYNASGSQVMVISGLNIPTAVEIVGDKIYVLDAPIVMTGASSSTTVPRISVYDKSGNQLSSFDANGDPEERLASPTDISVDGNNIYVSDAFHKAVLVYDLAGTYIGTVMSPGGEIDTAVSLTVSPDGIMYVSSSKTHSVQMFDIDTSSGVGVSTVVTGGGQ